MAAPLWKKLADEYINGSIDNPDLLDIANGLKANTMQLVELVEGLSAHLTNTDNVSRSRATRLLADVLHQLGTDFLNEKQVKLMVTFFCEKLSDHHSVQPQALHGLLAVASEPNLPAGCAEQICRRISADVHTQSLSQTDRHGIYTIFSHLLETSLKELQTMGGDFVFGFIQAMDMEKDPRNLHTAFHCAHTVIKNIPLGVFIEEMFEVVSCYFPMDYKPSPDDMNSVSCESLSQALQSCLCATPSFAPHCLPMLLEKLSSTLVSAKLDSFKALQACAPVYGAAGLVEFQASIFSCIKREVYYSGDPALHDAALLCLKAITLSLSQEITESGKKSILSSFVEDILKESKPHFTGANHQFLEPVTHVIAALSEACHSASCMVIQTILPTIIQQLQPHKQTTDQVKLFISLVCLLKSISHYAGSEAKDISPLQGLTQQVLDNLTTVMSTNDSDLEIRRVAAQGLTLLVQHTQQKHIQCTKDMETDALSEAYEWQRGIAVTLMSILVNEEDSSDLRNQAESGIKAVGYLNPKLVCQYVLPTLMKSIEDCSLARHEMIGRSLAAISCHLDIICETVPFLIKQIQLMASKDSVSEHDIAIAVSALKSICDIAQTSGCSNPEVSQYLFNNTLHQLLKLVLSTGVDITSDSVLHNSILISELGRFMRTVCMQVEGEQLLSWSSSFSEAFLSGGSLQSLGVPLASVESFKPLDVSSPCHQTQLVCLLLACLCSVPKQFHFPKEKQLFLQLEHLSLNSNHHLTYTAAAKCCAVLLNRWTLGHELEQLIHDSTGTCHQIITTSHDILVQSKALVYRIWLAKGLVLRGHPMSADVVKSVLQYCENDHLGDVAGDCTHIILTEYNDALTTDTNADVRLLYKQHLFTYTFPVLVQGFENSDISHRMYYLRAVSHLLMLVPRLVVIPHLNKIMPLLVHSLLCDDIKLQEVTMEMLCDVIDTLPELFVEHMDAIIKQLLRLSYFKQSMKIRIAALKCLGHITRLPHHAVYPHQRNVGHSLVHSLNDKKRLARYEAVKARSKWLLLGADLK